MIFVFPLWGVPGETLGSSAGFEGTPHGETRLIVDTDMGLDDARALFILAGFPGVDIEIVMTVEGSAAAGTGADNAIGLLETAGLADVRVLRGRSYPALEPPPWRAMAESLGGSAFPPPRALSQAPLDKDAHSRIAGALPGATVLSIGPAGNLARIERLRPGTLRTTLVIIPVHLDGTAVKGWNLERDPEAAAVVLEKAGEVVLVDTDAPVDDRHILCDLVGDTPAVRWILATVCGEDRAHSFIHDELGAAAAARPDLFETGSERYTVSLSDGTLRLAPGRTGNIRVARLRDSSALESFIHACWESPGAPEHEHVHASGGFADPIAAMRSFHGHLGPYVVIGYRMGRIALETTGSAGHFGIGARVYSTLEPPRSCLIDGVQMGSGCTLGKRNIAIEAYDGPPYAVFATNGGDTVIVSLLPAIPDSIARWIESEGVEDAGMRIWEMDEEALFSIGGPRR
ncbi:MAG: nucleoside hydrolase [Candidatus Krumholzibacteria bacterium]|nr:nucleoside hydrolase [Candidatus Krumholzibacteria bacterium]